LFFVFCFLLFAFCFLLFAFSFLLFVLFRHYRLENKSTIQVEFSMKYQLFIY
jgi:hypothetical protein